MTTQTPPTPLRPYAGVRLKLAKELTGFTGIDKTFRKIARAIPETFPPPPDYDPAAHKIYTAAELRRIKQWLLPDLPLPAHGAMPAIINFRMSKGGTGKTTVSANVAAILAMRGFRVLVIDADSQGSLSKLLGFDINLPLTHIGDLLQRIASRTPARIREAVVPVYAGGMLDLIPADISLANDMWLMSANGREHLMARLMEEEAEFFHQYDAVIIDSAPGTSLMTTTLMCGSNMLTAVVNPEPQAVAAVDILALNMEELNASVRRGLPALGLHIIVNGYNQSLKMHEESFAKLDANWGPNIDETIIPTYAGFLRELDLDDPSKSAPLIEKDPNSIGVRALIKVTDSIIRLYGLTINAAGAPDRNEVLEGVAA